MPPTPLLLLQGTRLTLGQPLLREATLSLCPGDRTCLVGRNGSGKSTLLRIAAGEMQADGGTRFLQPNTTFRSLPQEPDLSGFSSVADYVEAGLTPGDDPHRARRMLAELGLTGAEQPHHLSGGELRRAALVCAIAADPDLLLLDEPTNHLDLPAIEWLEAQLRSLRAGLVLISHDRRLLERVSRAVVWLDDGVTRRMDRGFAHFETWRDEVLDTQAQAHHKLARQIAREEDWMRYGVTARRKRNMRRVGEIAALRERHRRERRLEADLAMQASDAAASGRLVVVAEGLGKSYGDRAVVRDFDLRVLRGDRLGIVGPNGSGKTTLLGLLTGTLAPDTGRIRLGSALHIVTLDQQRRQLQPDVTLADTLTGGSGDQVTVNGVQRHVIGYMADFLFRPEQARTPVRMLSGGERGRLALACALAKPANLLVLDEPTNDLDLETLDLLQEVVAEHPGTVIVVSHDRDFLDRVATNTLDSAGDGRWVEYAGGYSDMVAQRGPMDPVAAQATSRTKVAGKVEVDPGTKIRKLSFRDKHALETLPAQIELLRSRLAQEHAVLDDATLYARDPARFKAAMVTVERLQHEIDAAEEQWLDIEIRREALAE